MAGGPGGGSRGRAAAAIAAVALVLVAMMGAASRRGPALADEFVYLAGARHFASDGSLDARYYDAAAILTRGIPHQDVHTPGYVLLLGGLMAVAGASYGTAVALNAAAYAAGALFVRRIALALGQDEKAAGAAAIVFLLLPVSLAYVYWVMTELALGAVFLGGLAVAAGARSAKRAVAAGLLFGAAFLIRESVLFGLPAVLALPPSRRRRVELAAAAAVFAAVVYAPLSAARAPGGANFWAPTSGRAFGHQAVQSFGAGRFGHAIMLALDRAGTNVRELTAASAAEQAILALYLVIPMLCAVGWRRRPAVQRQYVAALGAGYAAMVGVLFAFYVVGQWSGLRYLMVLVVAFLPVMVPPAPSRRDWACVLAVALLCLTVQPAVVATFNAYKASRQRRQENLTAYVEQRLEPGPMHRVALTNGWLFGWRHRRVEVISSLPADGGTLRLLERRVWFDYLVLPGNSPLADEWEGRTRYRRVNAAEADPPLLVYRRLR